VGDKDAPSVLQCENTLHGGHIILEGRLRFLDDAYVVTVLDKNGVHAFPIGAIGPGSMHQNNIPDATLLVLR
jgi:hypothetical protein